MLGRLWIACLSLGLPLQSQASSCADVVHAVTFLSEIQLGSRSETTPNSELLKDLRETHSQLSRMSDPSLALVLNQFLEIYYKKNKYAPGLYPGLGHLRTLEDLMLHWKTKPDERNLVTSVIRNSINLMFVTGLQTEGKLHRDQKSFELFWNHSTRTMTWIEFALRLSENRFSLGMLEVDPTSFEVGKALFQLTQQLQFPELFSELNP